MRIVQQTPTKLILQEKIPWLTWLFSSSLLTFFFLTFTIHFISFWWSVVFFVLVVLGTGLLFQITTCTFDKNLGMMTIKRKSLLGTKVKVIEHPIQEILGVEVHKITNSGPHGSVSTRYEVSLVLVSGRRVSLTSYSSSGKLRNSQTVANWIASFLQVNNYGLDRVPLPTFGEILLQTQKEESSHWYQEICLNPNEAEAHSKLAVALYKQGQTQEAVANFEKAIALFKAQGNDEQANDVRLIWDLLKMPQPFRRLIFPENP